MLRPLEPTAFLACRWFAMLLLGLGLGLGLRIVSLRRVNALVVCRWYCNLVAWWSVRDISVGANPAVYQSSLPRSILVSFGRACMRNVVFAWYFPDAAIAFSVSGTLVVYW